MEPSHHTSPHALSTSAGYSRRRFIQGGAALAAGAIAMGTGAGTLAAQEEEARKRMNQGKIYKSVKTGGGISRQQMKEIKALGFDGIESVSPGVGDTAALRKMAAEEGLHIHGVVDMVHWNQRLSDPDPAVREVGRKALDQAVRDAYELGGSSVLLVPGRVSGENETHDDVWNRSIEEIRKVLPTASWYGIHILIETVWNGFCYSPEQLRDYIDEIGNPWVRVYYDIGNMQKFRPSHEWITVLGSRIVKFDIKDWGEENGFCPLGQGDVDWAAVRREMDKIGFTGWVTREGSDGSLENTARLMNELLDL